MPSKRGSRVWDKGRWWWKCLAPGCSARSRRTWKGSKEADTAGQRHEFKHDHELGLVQIDEHRHLQGTKILGYNSVDKSAVLIRLK